jgi:hypothetical protein
MKRVVEKTDRKKKREAVPSPKKVAKGKSTKGVVEFKKRVREQEQIHKKQTKKKRMSIEIMGYFSKEFKSAFSEAQQMDIKHLSELLTFSETTMSKSPMPVTFLDNKSSYPYIHSMKSLKSLKAINRVMETREQGRLVELALKKKQSNLHSHAFD